MVNIYTYAYVCVYSFKIVNIKKIATNKKDMYKIWKNICFIFSEWINTQFVVTRKELINFINKIASNQRKYRKTKSKEEIKTKGKRNQNIQLKGKKNQNIQSFNDHNINIDGN